MSDPAHTCFTFREWTTKAAISSEHSPPDGSVMPLWAMIFVCISTVVAVVGFGGSVDDTVGSAMIVALLGILLMTVPCIYQVRIMRAKWI